MNVVPGAGLEGEAGELRLTVWVATTLNSRPSYAGFHESFGKETYASGLPAQVFQGTLMEAVEPETEKDCAVAVVVLA